MHEFPCPNCHIPLRVRDETYRNRTIACPECRQAILIQELDGRLVGTLPATLSTEETLLAPRSGTRGWGTPQWIAVSVAAVLLLGIGYFAIDRTPQAPKAPEQPSAAPPERPQAAAPELPTIPALPPLPATPPGLEAPQKLTAIGKMIADSVASQEHYPHSTQPKNSSGWSWIAELADAELPHTTHRHHEQGWDAAGNDEFVRRSLPEFLNPLVEQKAGDDNYPTSHFVGVTGVGADAATLPKDHPRAGIFGENRKTTPTDVTDGISQTMMVAGAASHLGSWARPGAATSRSFSQTPYINGPDGFSTGQPDGMFVLMADGSVRFLNQATDPVIVRRMAAMADGVPLDADLSRDPLLSTPQQMPAPEVPKPPVPIEMPIPVPVSPEPPRIDLAARLNQRLTGFEQSQPAPLEDLLFDVQELIGLPIDLSSLPEETRKTPVAISLQATTVGDVLKEIAKAAQLGYAVHPDRITIQPLPSASK